MIASHHIVSNRIEPHRDAPSELRSPRVASKRKEEAVAHAVAIHQVEYTSHIWPAPNSDPTRSSQGRYYITCLQASEGRQHWQLLFDIDSASSQRLNSRPPFKFDPGFGIVDRLHLLIHSFTQRLALCRQRRKTNETLQEYDDLRFRCSFTRRNKIMTSISSLGEGHVK